MEEKKQSSFSVNWKDAIWVVTLLLGMSGSYFTMKNRVDNLEKQVNANNKILHDNNLELLQYQVKELKDSQDAFIETWNDFLNDYYDRSAH